MFAKRKTIKNRQKKSTATAVIRQSIPKVNHIFRYGNFAGRTSVLLLIIDQLNARLIESITIN